MGGCGDAMKDKIELNVIADALIDRIMEMIRGQNLKHGSITFIFSPESDTIYCNVETRNRISLKNCQAKSSLIKKK
jgi:hypothetical protein